MSPPNFVLKFREFDDIMRMTFRLAADFNRSVAYEVETSPTTNALLDTYSEIALNLSASLMRLWNDIPTSNIGTLVDQSKVSQSGEKVYGCSGPYTAHELELKIQRNIERAERLRTTIISRHRTFVDLITDQLDDQFARDFMSVLTTDPPKEE